MKPLEAGEAALFWSQEEEGEEVLYVLSDAGAGGVRARIVGCELTRLGVIYTLDRLLLSPVSPVTLTSLPPPDSAFKSEEREELVETVETEASLGSGGRSTSAYLVIIVILGLYGLKTIPAIKYII